MLNNWITEEKKKILWLSSDYQATYIVIQNEIVVLRRLSESVMFLKFELTKETL